MATATTATRPPQEVGQSSTAEQQQQVAQDARFSCNICFDAVSEPVVTRCGHLYCWPCLYKWLAPGMGTQERASIGMPRSLAPLDRGRRVCPVCKSECSVPTVVPIYVRSSDNSAPPEPLVAEEERGRVSSDFSSVENNTHQMGLDIDDDDLDLGLDIDDNPPEDAAIPTTVTTTTDGAPLGLRQRRRNESRDELNALAIVPTRPVPSRDRAASENSGGDAAPRAHSPADNGPTTQNHYASATLSYGLVLAMHQTLLNATNSNDASPTAPENNEAGGESVPSLHYPQPQRQNSVPIDSSWDQDPASTVFLSRLLLGLSLFVLFCLLSF